MINSNKRWLLTASPWAKPGQRLSRFTIGAILFSALLVFSFGASKAQVGTSKSHTVRTTGTPGTTTGTFTPAIPVITGSTTTTCVGTHITLTNAATGGTWSASNANVTLTAAGSSVDVLGNTPGTTVVTYTVGIYSISTTVTITSPIAGPGTVCIGNSVNLTDATPTGLWSVDNPAIATVSVTGVVTGITAGTANITYGRAGSCTVTQAVVVSANNITSITPALPVVCVSGVNNTTTLTANLTSGTGGSWTSSSTLLATVGSTGTGTTATVTAVAAGNPTITYVAASGCTATKTVIVNGTLPAAITPASPLVCVGGSATLTDATAGGAWTSSNTSLATINSAGVATGIAIGTPIITYTKNACYRTASLSVAANTISFSGNTPICGTSSITITPTPSGGTWTSSNPLVATVGSLSGTVTGVTPGTSLLTYSIAGGCSSSLTVTVNAGTSAGSLSGPAAVCQLATVSLSSSAPGGTWASSNTAIGSVDAFGHVTGVAVAGGSFTITYSRLGCSTTKSMAVNVLPAITGASTLCLGATTTLGPTGGTWASVNPSVATVNASTGVVTGIADGSTGISYTDVNSCTSVKQVTVNGPTAILGGNTACSPLSTGGIPTYLYLSDAVSGGTWSIVTVPASGVASINSSSGIVTPVGTGTGTVTYAKSGCSVTKSININPLPALITGNAAVCVGSTTTLADVTAGGSWTSTNPAIGSIDALSGIVTGRATGGTLISYTVAGCSQTMNVTVGPALHALTTTSSNVCNGFGQVTLSTTDPGGLWTTSNTNIVISGSTSSATITAVGNTTGAVTITYSLGGCSVPASLTVISNTTGSISGVPFACTGLTTTLTSSTVSGVWSVRDPSYATITAGSTTTGIVTGVSAGTTVVTYTNPANGCFKTFVFNVEPQPASITGGGSGTLCDGSTLALSDASAGGAWTSSNTAIAVVGSTGVVSGRAAGTVVITYALPGGCESYRPLAVLTTPNSIIYKSKHYGGVCTNPANPGHIAIAYDSVTGGTWSNPSGLVTFNTSSPYGNDSVQIIAGSTAGVASVTYTLPNGCFVTTNVTVGAVVPTIADANNLTPWNFCLGGTLDTLQISSGPYTTGLRAWSVLNKNSMFVSNIATVSNYSSSGGGFAGGGVQGIAAGVATVTYTYNGCWATQDITVSANTSTGVTGPSALCSSALSTGHTFTLLDPLTALSMGDWISNNTAVATVNNVSGLATGVAAGSAIISYAVRYGGCIDVLPLNVGATVPVAITSGTNPLCLGTNSQYTDATAGGTWTSSDNTILSVNSLGYVDAVGTGTANITYTLNGCYPAPVSIAVNPLPTITGGAGQLCTGGATGTLTGSGGGTWRSVKPSVATINAVSGVVTAVGGDTVTLVYTDANGCIATAVDTIGRPVTGFTFTSGSANMCSGAMQTINATPSSKLGAWTGSNPLLANVSGYMGGSGAYFVVGIVTANAGHGSGAVTVSYTPPACPTQTTTINVVDAGVITGSTGVCTTGTTSVTVLTDTSGSGLTTSWGLLTPALGSLTSSGNTATYTGSSAGVDIVTYTVVSVSPALTCVDSQQINITACLPRGNQPGSNATPGEQKYTLFPNPSSGLITIRQSEAIDGTATLTVINSIGATIYNGAIDFSGGESQLNLPNAAPGMYLVMLKDSKGKAQTFKVIIEN